jgi:hypothetical protein
MKIFNKLAVPALAFALSGLFLTSCKKDNTYSAPEQVSVAKGKNLSSSFASVVLTEDFEVGSTSPKTAYDVSPTGSSSGDNVTLHGNSWNMFDALIGNLSTDKKSGAWSGRIRNTGKITMLFDVTTGISTVTIKSALFGTDGTSTWGLWYSTNGGSTWTQSGTAVTPTTTLAMSTFTITVTGTARLEIRKLTGGTNRINIDDITINDNTSGGGTGGGTILTGKKFLFDATKYENAGSADWQN